MHLSPTYLRAAFTPIATKSVSIQSGHWYLFTLLGSMGAKAARRTFLKLTADPKIVKTESHCHAFGIYGRVKASHKMSMKLTTLGYLILFILDFRPVVLNVGSMAAHQCKHFCGPQYIFLTFFSNFRPITHFVVSI